MISRSRLVITISSLVIMATAVVSIVLFSRYTLPVMAEHNSESHLTSATPSQGPSYHREAMFYQNLGDGLVECNICFRNCVIPQGERGYCKNKENKGGTLYNIVHGRPSAVQIDPVEKEPMYHMMPGTQILCIGTAGCNFSCNHCQNWHLSQRSIEDLNYYNLPPEAIVRFALEQGIPTISFTYNDPISVYEYVYDVAKLAKENGLKIIWHSNGAINPEPLRKLLQYTDAVTIDLKGFSQKAYDNANAELAPVLEALKIIHQAGVWVEIVNLVIPTVNDDINEIREMCEWIKNNLGPYVPVHFSRFHPSYKMKHLPSTPIKTLEKAHSIAEEVGMHFITVGNVPGHSYNSTYCPGCDEKIIHRVHFSVLENKIKEGKCGYCGYKIPGIWQ
ncbi:AmmeMemoRadiSam system radical SAM enzyme [Chitinispirillales bacterium ANBcel5]|uniref:AmmeMemoRadiSam system radical SAM enzyme n=1 Tax=Cellulosispirillum alkaliphilum TaxID=3039283 RepID=UPI002A555089|nr:AmmeMemoRadiSam system radical SAM enzyme [Chitinispirillales bacterium ANBcel5]